MKKFLVIMMWFLFPILLFAYSLELFIRYYPNSFNTKAKYLKNNLNDIEVLFLGASHIQNGINPELLELRAANLAYGSQDYKLNNALFFSYINRLSKLKYVVIEIDYPTLEFKNDNNYFRLPWYFIYHDIEVSKINVLNKWSLYSTSPSFFNNYLLRQLNPFDYDYTVNEFGFITNDFPGVFLDVGYNEMYLMSSAKNRLLNHNKLSIENYNYNIKMMNEVIAECINKNIAIILVKSPVYKSYRENYNNIKLNRRDVYIDSLIRSSRMLKLLDFESNSQFEAKHFKNDDHLNSVGAQKLTLLINNYLNNCNANYLQ